jgi:hypothetical protein
VRQPRYHTPGEQLLCAAGDRNLVPIIDMEARGGTLRSETEQDVTWARRITPHTSRTRTAAGAGRQVVPDAAGGDGSRPRGHRWYRRDRERSRPSAFTRPCPSERGGGNLDGIENRHRMPDLFALLHQGHGIHR